MSSNQIPSISNTELIILQILLDKAGSEIYGWELIEKSDGTLKKGTIYVVLNRMEEKGYISSRKEQRRKGERGLPRRMYKLTGTGEKTISAWNFAQDKFNQGVLI